MVSSYRIKEYIFPSTDVADADYSATGSKLTKYSSHSINGEILRIDAISNYTGSISLNQSGLNVPWLNGTVTSGTGAVSFSFTNNTGSFVTNNLIRYMVSGVMSGTGVNIGAVSILYR